MKQKTYQSPQTPEVHWIHNFRLRAQGPKIGRGAQIFAKIYIGDPWADLKDSEAIYVLETAGSNFRILKPYENFPLEGVLFQGYRKD